MTYAIDCARPVEDFHPDMTFVIDGTAQLSPCYDICDCARPVEDFHPDMTLATDYARQLSLGYDLCG